MSILGDAESFFGALVDGVTGSSPQVEAPVPTVSSGPPGPVEPATWTAPDASGDGHITVHRTVLNSVSRGMHSDVSDLDTAVTSVKSVSGGLSSLARWSTGSGFSANVQNAVHGFATTGSRLADTQTTASKILADSAASYEEAETSNRQAINRVGSQLDASGGSVYQAGGI
jgi:hypothetical protein